ncbi:MAG: hypothetical protein Q7U44_02395 [Desulfuromonadales bacterium]|nr:hypothetical protein [Desulfuromonadales bacterium]
MAMIMISSVINYVILVSNIMEAVAGTQEKRPVTEPPVFFSDAPVFTGYSTYGETKKEEGEINFDFALFFLSRSMLPQ